MARRLYEGRIEQVFYFFAEESDRAAGEAARGALREAKADGTLDQPDVLTWSPVTSERSVAREWLDTIPYGDPRPEGDPDVTVGEILRRGFIDP